MKKRNGWISTTVECDVEIDVMDVIDSIDTDVLKEELSRRNIRMIDDQTIKIPETGDLLKRMICDFLEISYHASKPQILTLLSDRI